MHDRPTSHGMRLVKEAFNGRYGAQQNELGWGGELH